MHRLLRGDQWWASPRLWVEWFLLANLAFLAVDISLAHAINAFEHQAERIPIYFSVAATFLLLVAMTLGGSEPVQRGAAGSEAIGWRRSLARGIGLAVGWGSIVVGIAGLVWHLRGDFFQEQTIKNLVYTAPFAAPLAYTGLGLLLILDRMVDARSLEWSRWVILLAAGGFLGNFVLSLADHAQNGFFYPSEWIGVIAAAAAFGFLLAQVVVPDNPSLLAMNLALMVIQVVVGVLGFALHARDNLTNQAGSLLGSLHLWSADLRPLAVRRPGTARGSGLLGAASMPGSRRRSSVRNTGIARMIGGPGQFHTELTSPPQVANRGRREVIDELLPAAMARPCSARPPLTLSIRRIDCASSDALAAIAEFRRELSPGGNVVSPEGRARTVAAFGEPLTPVQVVERICADVATRGLAAVLDYTCRLDGVALEPGSIRVSRAELESAHESADAGYLQTLENVRANILAYQRAILNRDVRLEPTLGIELGVRVCSPAPGRRLHSRWGSGLSLDAPDDGGPGAGGGRGGDRRRGTSHTVRRLQHGPAGGMPRPGRDRSVPYRRRSGSCRAGVRCRGYSGRGQDCRPGQPLRRARQEAGLWRGRYRQHRRAQRSRADRRRIGRTAGIVAADLISQAEHSPGVSILLTWEPSLIDRVADALDEQLGWLGRGDLARDSLARFGALILVRDEAEAVRMSNLLAPEHLHISTMEPQRIAARR